MESELVFFEPDTKNISALKKIIKKQGENTCQNQIDIDYLPIGSSEADISDTLKDFRFGLMAISKKAQIGRRSLNDESDRYYLNGFVICYVHQEEPDEMIINIVCSNKNTKIGKMLMEIAEEQAKKMKIKKIILYSLRSSPKGRYSLDEIKLKKWYESLGFYQSVPVFTGKNIPKLRKMIKKL